MICWDEYSYSGSDIKSLCKEASLGPIRELGMRIRDMKEKDVRGIQMKDFQEALRRIRPSVPNDSIQKHIDWVQQFGIQQT